MRREGDGELEESATGKSLSQSQSEFRLEPQFSSLDLEALPEPGSELEVQLKHLQLLVDKDTARVAEVVRQWVSGNEQR
ncbi:hypothetical protein [Aeromonas caviae]